MKNFADKLICAEYEAYMLTSPYSIRYYTGFTGGEGIALIGSFFKILITDSRYTEAAETEAEGFKIVEKAPYHSAVKDIFEEHGIKKVYFEDAALSVSDYNKIREISGSGFDLIGASDEIEKKRAVKELWETELIRKSEEIAVSAFEHILDYIKPGVSEFEIAAELEYFMKKRGAEKTSFDTIVLSGKKTSMPHGKPDYNKINPGDFVTMDFGCVYKGYCSDMTRTVVAGKATEEQKKVYNTVLSAQTESSMKIAAGAKASEIDKTARDIIAGAGFGNYFGHALGHGVGLLIHEAPNLSPKSGYILEENMIVTCEPGIYIPGKFGVRIEDLLCVKQGGAVNFTPCEKKLLEIL